MMGQRTYSPILALDQAGNPHALISVETAVTLLVTDRVIAPLGEEKFTLYGGTNRATGRRSHVEVNSILLTRTRVVPRLWADDYAPPLTNRALFARDRFCCQYCGKRMPSSLLTRDHIIPRSMQGPDTWTNITTACRRCNGLKGNRTPQQWGTELLSVPYTPCYAEHLLLAGRTILADQSAFIRARMKRKH